MDIAYIYNAILLNNTDINNCKEFICPWQSMAIRITMQIPFEKVYPLNRLRKKYATPKSTLKKVYHSVNPATLDPDK